MALGVEKARDMDGSRSMGDRTMHHPRGAGRSRRSHGEGNLHGVVPRGRDEAEDRTRARAKDGAMERPDRRSQPDLLCRQ